MTIMTFEERVQAVHASRDKWIGLIVSRLNDLTGLKRAWDKAYHDPQASDNADIKAIETGRKTVVIFPTDKIAKALGTDDMYRVWQYILGYIGTEKVFLEQEVQYYTESLGGEAEKQLTNILHEIRRSNDSEVIDVMGIFSPSRHTIKIYAQVIAYYSIKLGVPAEDLAFVVLAHELAHAYTIAGYDINASRGIMMDNIYNWDTDVIEGLAQYYTEAVCGQLDEDYPGFKAAFEKLRAKQTDPYTWYHRWFDSQRDHERLRSLLIQYRNTLDSGKFRNGV